MAVLIISAELISAAIWFILPKFGGGPPGGAYSFRAQHRMLAFSDWVQHPSQDTKAAWDSELAQLRQHNLITRDIPSAALLLLVSGGIAYVVWNYRSTPRTA